MFCFAGARLKRVVWDGMSNVWVLSRSLVRQGIEASLGHRSGARVRASRGIDRQGVTMVVTSKKVVVVMSSATLTQCRGPKLQCWSTERVVICEICSLSWTSSAGYSCSEVASGFSIACAGISRIPCAARRTPCAERAGERERAGHARACRQCRAQHRESRSEVPHTSIELRWL